jgi:DNA processing protein
MRRLLERFPEPREAMEAGVAALTDLRLATETLSYLRRPDWEGVEQDLAWVRAGERRFLLTIQDASYPERLREIHDPPCVLFVRGDPAVLALAQLAVVGSRNPTAVGRETAYAFAGELARRGLAITSGLAQGVDAAGHLGSLDAGGITIAVAGSGPDRVYPAQHRDLDARIVEQGAVVSEYPTGTPPLPEHFPKRNRIITGLSLGVLVVEAARQSGSLISARLAAEQGREVFAVPGSIHNPLARGCHMLIRQGAKLVETAEDILEEIGPVTGLPAAWEVGTRPREKPAERDPSYQKLLESLDYAPTPVDVLVERTGLTAAEVSSMLLILELKGLVKSASGGSYTRVPG